MKKKKNKKIKTRAKESAKVPESDNKDGLNFRNMSVEVRAAEGDNAAAVVMSVSSEEPVLTSVFFNDCYQQVYEILDHGEGSIDMSRAKDGLVVLDRHYGDQVGLMQVKVEGGKMTGPVEFCSGDRAQELSKDAAKGLRRNVSVGYRVNAETYRVEGEQDGIPMVRAMSWMPYEASFEPVPADITVGVNRAEKIEEPQNAEPVIKKEVRTMTPKEYGILCARAAKYGISIDKVTELVNDDSTVESVRASIDGMIVEKQGIDLEEERKINAKLKDEKPEARNMPVVPAEIVGGDVETENKIMRKFSVLNVLRHALGITEDIHGTKVDIGFEREIDTDCRKMGMGSQRGGQFIIPHAALAKRDFTVAGTSSYTVATDLDPTNFIELLRTKMVIGAAGMKYLTGLVGTVAIPKMTAGSTGYWVAESGAITESEPTPGQVTGTPHTCGVMTDISRRLLLQSTPSAEALVRDEILQRIARTIQIAIFQGSGAGGEPSNITTADGINAPGVTDGTPTYEELLGFPGAIMADNAEADDQKWIFTAEVWQKLAATFTDGTAKAEHVLDWKSKTCLGFPYLVTEDVGENSGFFGDWSTVMLGMWGAGIDLNMDTATLSSSGGLRIVGLQDVDIMVRQGKALAYDTGITS